VLCDYDKTLSTTCRRLFVLLATFAFTFLLATSAHAATYYVATSGSDSNPGSETAPFKTIASGSQALASGDTLYIRAGTYAETMQHGERGFVFRNGTAGSYTRYAAYPGEQVIIRPPRVGPGSVVFFHKNSAYIEINGLVLDGINTKDTAVVMWHDEKEYPHHIRIKNNEIVNSGTGIGGGDQSEIIGNKIHTLTAYGIYGSGSNTLVEGNIIRDTGGYGLHLYQSYSPVNNWVIRNNVFVRTGLKYGWVEYYGGPVMGYEKQPAVVISRGKGTQFYNNLVYNNGAGGVQIWSNGNDVLVANNTIYENGGYGIDVSRNIRDARVINNISWGNKGQQIQDFGVNTTLQNNLTTDPGVVNAGGGDFHLQSSSPAVDKGMTLAEVPNDFDYGKRAFPVGGNYDIGAFEFGAPPGTTPSPPIPGGLPPGGGGGGGGDPLGLGHCFK
jgi:Right handed beta helix region